MIPANNPSLRSWVPVAKHSDFPIQNLPFGIFKRGEESALAGVAIGESVLNLDYLHRHGYLDGLGIPVNIFSHATLNDFIALGRSKTSEVRNRISELLRHDNDVLKQHASAPDLLIPLKDVHMQMPIHVGNYTDFYSSEEHATNVGSMFRDPEKALLPNWKHLPVGYHGRASSIVISGTPLHRPKGQMKTSDDTVPSFCPTQKLDFEVEVAFITCQESALGSPINIQHAEEYIFGFVLLNDWSARDIQQWEYAPLGPFLGKSFGTTISPWIVTLDALEPFRVKGPDQFPHVLPYLAYSGDKSFDIMLEALLQPEGGEPTTVCRTNFKYLYWNIAQQLAHQTVNGCNVQVGDVYASGTISGPSPGSFGSLLELSWNGQRHLHLSDGTERTFIEDGDTVIMKGHCEKEGVRIGFGECSGTVLKAK
jgi:fumarylacetoacetase